MRSGIDKGKIGKVLKVNRGSNSLIVEGVNVRLKKYSIVIFYFRK